MGFFKKRFEKNVTRDNEFLKRYAIKVNGLLIFTEDNEKITGELKLLMNDFQYTMPSSSSDAKKFEKIIAKNFELLSRALQQPEWSEEEVSLMIKKLRRNIVEISSMI